MLPTPEVVPAGVGEAREEELGEGSAGGPNEGREVGASDAGVMVSVTWILGGGVDDVAAS